MCRRIVGLVCCILFRFCATCMPRQFNACLSETDRQKDECRGMYVVLKARSRKLQLRAVLRSELSQPSNSKAGELSQRREKKRRYVAPVGE